MPLGEVILKTYISSEGFIIIHEFRSTLAKNKGA